MKRKRLLCLMIAMLLAVFMATGCDSSETNSGNGGEAENQSYEAGTYTATIYGYLSDVTVETTFSESEITEVSVVEQNETPELFTLVEEQVPAAIVEHQSLSVDSVTGATMSSVAVVRAVSDCVEQAGADPSALRAKEIEKQAGEDEVYETDVVVVGLGASGFMAAHNAAINGADVMAIEKGASVAVSNGVKVSGPFAVDTPVLREMDSKLTVGKAFYHMMDYSHWSVNAPLVRRSLETSKEAVTQLMDMGYEFREADFRFETPFKNEYGGFHLILNPLEERVNIWENTLEKDGVDVLFDTTGEKLIQDGDEIVGVEATKKDGTKVTVNADAVILATGGFVGNKEMVREYFSGAEINPAGGSLSTGDGINMAVEVGA
ncbi:MAG TPA: hypothetical protein DHN33_09730, partial [Eubacteriaceae bacterium]|nr:hypothetical protein [Eubacteriaceae bacterium]